MSDWQVGDLAVCVKDYDRPDRRGLIVKRGMSFRVLAVTPGVRWKQGYVADALTLSGVAHVNPSGSSSRRFRKIKPDEHTANGECEQLLDLLKRSKTGVPASARVFDQFFNTIARPTETQLWLERAAEELREERMKGQRK